MLSSCLRGRSDEGWQATSGAMQLQTHTTAFANVNWSKEVWWFDIPLAKIGASGCDALDLLVATADTKLLHHLHVPLAWLRENLSSFHIRDDKQCVSLEISSREGDLFRDIRPGSKRMQFARYLVMSLPSSTKEGGMDLVRADHWAS